MRDTQVAELQVQRRAVERPPAPFRHADVGRPGVELVGELGSVGGKRGTTGPARLAWDVRETGPPGPPGLPVNLPGSTY